MEGDPRGFIFRQSPRKHIANLMKPSQETQGKSYQKSYEALHRKHMKSSRKTTQENPRNSIKPSLGSIREILRRVNGNNVPGTVIFETREEFLETDIGATGAEAHAEDQ